MKLKEYAERIALLAKHFPEAKVVYARDDEGNGFQEVYYLPGPGIYKDGEFHSAKQTDTESPSEIAHRLASVDAICVN